MTAAEIYKALQTGGAYSLPYLIKLSHPDAGALYFVNNCDNITYGGNIYAAAGFKYTKPQTVGGVLKNGTLQISAIDNTAIELLDNSDELFTVDVVGVIDNYGEITPIKSFRHQYGTVTVDETLNLTISFTNDDRMSMVFPPYVFDQDNNRGNA